MTSQTILPYLNISFTLFISNDFFNHHNFLLGALACLDSNWDGTELWLDSYHKDVSLACNILLAIVSVGVTLFLVGLVALAESSNASQLSYSYKESVDVNNKTSNPSTINLVYLPIIHEGWDRHFFYDRNNLTGTNLRTLFWGRNYDEYTHEGAVGFLAPKGNKLTHFPNSQLLPLFNITALKSQINLLEANNIDINTNNNPIRKVHTHYGNVGLYVQQPN